MLSKDDLLELSKVDINLINESELKEITKIQIDSRVPIEERIQHFFDEIGNPYCFLIDGSPVQISFANHNNTSLDECLFNYFTEKR